jgi:hypothetical protein
MRSSDGSVDNILGAGNPWLKCEGLDGLLNQSIFFIAELYGRQTGSVLYCIPRKGIYEIYIERYLYSISSSVDLIS